MAKKTASNEAIETTAMRQLFKLSAARSHCKTRETELVSLRKELETQMDELGAGSTARHLAVRSDYVITIRMIEWHRSRVKTIADKMQYVVDQAQQGSLFELDDSDISVKQPGEAELFRPAPKDDRPVGEADGGDLFDGDEDDETDQERGASETEPAANSVSTTPPVGEVPASAGRWWFRPTTGPSTIIEQAVIGGVIPGLAKWMSEEAADVIVRDDEVLVRGKVVGRIEPIRDDDGRKPSNRAKKPAGGKGNAAKKGGAR